MTIVVAHRGVPRVYPENTLRSICLAEEKGADAVEFDVRTTSDGRAVLLHDQTLQKLWGDPRPVSDVSFADVRALTVKTDGVADCIPTFEEVVEKTNLTLIIDCKATEIVGDLERELVRTGQSHRARFIGEPEILTTVRRLIPKADIILSWSKPAPPPRDLLDEIRPSTLNLEFLPGNEAWFTMMRDLGYPLWTYTIDEVSEARRAVSLGAAAVITNDLDGVGSALRSRGAGTNS